MNLEWVIMPFIFAAIYFEAFLLVTFLNRPQLNRSLPKSGEYMPHVAMIVPCFNEETTIDGTVQSLLALDYPHDKLDIFLINDGSTDGTKEVMDRYVGTPGITVIHKENSGKHTALNLGIERAVNAEFIGGLDADSFVDPSAMKEVVLPFFDKKVAAVTSAMSIYKPKNLLEHTQNAEYIMGIALRYILAMVNGLYVTPGPLSLYRKSIFAEIGGFRKAHNAEDMEMALRIQKHNYLIANAPLARVYTKAPRHAHTLVKQRTRWATGFLRNVLFDYRDLVGNPKNMALGFLVLPLGFLSLIGALIGISILLYNFVRNAVETYLIVSGVPVAYVLRPDLTFDWFYFPITGFLLFGFVATIGAVVLVVLGKNISQTKGPITLGIIGYLFVYGLISPFWLVRSFWDVFTNKQRGWR